MTFKYPTTGEKLRAIHFTGIALCTRCAHAGGKYVRPENCPDCAKTARRLKEVRAWLSRRGELPGGIE